ncbi:hypothetical protein PaeCFBP13512_12825 [Paenibacillus sp. CFBP13512]|nr:hypothetical protein PaeCFBP13512_12825 [Paenibacillus sp. CFBP13512]
MKNLFKSFYKPTEEEFNELWQNCIFVFDTNTLLNLYRYPEKTRELFLNILEKLEGRIWIPYQVAFEYHKNLNDELHKQDNGYSSFEELIDSSINELVSKIEKKATDLRHSNITVEKIITTITEAKESVKAELKVQKDEHPDLEELKESLNFIIGDKVGRPYTQEELDKIYETGQKRYENEIPPGFKDLSDKKGKTSLHNGLIYKDEYGDLVYWFQIIEKAKESNIKSIILISDDSKEDWVYKFKGQKKGLHPELMNEFVRETEKQFYLYNSERFIEYAKKFFNVNNQISIEEAISDIEKTKKIEGNKLNDVSLGSNFLLANALEHFLKTKSSSNHIYFYKISIFFLSDDYDSIAAHVLSIIREVYNQDILIVDAKLTNRSYEILIRTIGKIDTSNIAIKSINTIASFKIEKYSENFNYVVEDIELINETRNSFTIDNNYINSKFEDFKSHLHVEGAVLHDRFGTGTIIGIRESDLIVRFNNITKFITEPYENLTLII